MLSWKPRTKRQHPTAALLSFFIFLLLYLFIHLFIFFFYFYFAYIFLLLPPSLASSSRRIGSSSLQAALFISSGISFRRRRNPPPYTAGLRAASRPSPPDQATSVGLCARLPADACLAFRKYISSYHAFRLRLQLLATTRRSPSSRCRPPPSSQNRALLKAQNPRPSSRRTRERDRLLCSPRMGLRSSLHPQARPS